MKVTVPAILGFIVLSLCSWRVHEVAQTEMNKVESVEIIVYNPSGVTSNRSPGADRASRRRGE